MPVSNEHVGELDRRLTRLERIRRGGGGATGPAGPTGPTGATGATGPSPWLSVKGAPYNAKGDGVTNDAPAINAALAACPSGGTVWMPPGTYAVLSPLIVPPNITLLGDHGNRINYKLAAEWPGVPQTNYIKPLAGFSGAAVVRLLDKEEGGYAAESVGQRLTNFTIDGSALAGGAAVDGVRATGKVREVFIDRVACQYMPRAGFVTATYTRADSSVVYPYSWYVANSIARACANFGFAFPGLTDSHIFNCQSLGAGVSGFFLSGMANSHVTDCRAEWSTQHGFLVTGATSNGGAIFTACSTDRNGFDGIHVDCTGRGPVMFIGCMLRRDGRNGKAGGGGYAGFRAQSAQPPIIVNGLTTFTGQDDDATGVFSPQIGLRASGSTVMVDNAYAHGFVTPVTDDGDNAHFYLGANVVKATGSPFAPAITSFPV
jgi:hypothetical protein